MPVASSLAVVLLGASLAATSPAPLLRIQDPALLESSGLAASAWHEGILWTHADGGSVAEVRALDSGGETVATITLEGIDPYDPEALAPGDRQGLPTLFLGDIGDNLEKRPDVSVFRFAEPLDVRDQTVEATWYRFTYPDGPHDAEALLVHPGTGRVLIATKSLGGGGLYEAPPNLLTADEGSNRLVRVADAPPLVTDGAYLPDGRFVLRTYATVLVYDRPGHQVGSAALPLQPQGESLAVDGDALLVGSEGRRSAVYAVPVPPTTAGPEPRAEAPSSTPSATPPTGGAADDSPWRTAYRVARVGGILVVLVAVIAYLRRGRRRSR